MKKIIAMLLAVLLLVSAAACQKTPEEESKADEPVERVQLQLLGGAGLQYCAIDASIAPDSAWLE